MLPEEYSKLMDLFPPPSPRLDRVFIKCLQCEYSEWASQVADPFIWDCPNCKKHYEIDLQAKPVPKSWLEEAQEVTTQSRQQEYGNPLINFLRTAIEWTMWLQARKKLPVVVNPIDVAWMMDSMKLAREMHTAKRDNGVDSIGYLSCADRIDTYMRDLGYPAGAAAFETMTLSDLSALLEKISPYITTEYEK